MKENKERLRAKINGISTPIGDALSVVIPGHQIKGGVRKIPVAGEQQWYSSIFLDGEFVCGVNFGKRGKCFCSCVTRWAMRGVASHVGKNKRKKANENRPPEPNDARTCRSTAYVKGAEVALLISVIRDGVEGAWRSFEAWREQALGVLRENYPGVYADIEKKSVRKELRT